MTPDPSPNVGTLAGTGLRIFGPASLSPQQWRVLEVLSQGRSHSEAAGDLGITYSTLKGHLQRAFTRLDVSSLVGAFSRLGWLSPSRPAVEWHVTEGWRIA